MKFGYDVFVSFTANRIIMQKHENPANATSQESNVKMYNEDMPCPCLTWTISRHHDAVVLWLLRLVGRAEDKRSVKLWPFSTTLHPALYISSYLLLLQFYWTPIKIPSVTIAYKGKIKLWPSLIFNSCSSITPLFNLHNSLDEAEPFYMPPVIQHWFQ